MGVISNYDQRLSILLRNMKLDQYLDFAINSYDAGCEKPHEGIFKEAMRQSELPDLRPDQCLHIGESPVDDYMGARAAGWSAALVHEKHPENLLVKYGSDMIKDQHVFGSLFDFSKRLSNDEIQW